jgi:hypothetical protein
MRRAVAARPGPPKPTRACSLEPAGSDLSTSRSALALFPVDRTTPRSALALFHVARTTSRSALALFHVDRTTSRSALALFHVDRSIPRSALALFHVDRSTSRSALALFQVDRSTPRSALALFHVDSSTALSALALLAHRFCTQKVAPQRLCAGLGVHEPAARGGNPSEPSRRLPRAGLAPVPERGGRRLRPKAPDCPAAEAQKHAPETSASHAGLSPLHAHLPTLRDCQRDTPANSLKSRPAILAPILLY